MSSIEALYIFDEHKYVSRSRLTRTVLGAPYHHSLYMGLTKMLSALLLDYVYTSAPPPPPVILPLYLQHASPRPSLLYLPSLGPHSLLFSMIQDNLLFLSPCSSDIEPLLVLEFLHRVADALQEFLGSPLLAGKITASYDVVAQVVSEMADAGVIAHSEPNALRDTVETGPGVLKNLLGSLGAPGSSPALQPTGVSHIISPQIQQAQSAQGSAVPWRRSNVRHTSNELYVDIVESLAVTLAPSGRPLSAFVHGSIAFTSKVSGVPDLTLNLSSGGHGAGMGSRGEQLRRLMERVVFHPCVRLSRWTSDGLLSFVPPDGRFALCGYEVDLLGPDAFSSAAAMSARKLDLPATLEITTNLGSTGAEFEIRVSLSPGGSRTSSAAAASLQSNLGALGSARGLSQRAAPGGESKNVAIEGLTVRVPIPAGARNIIDLRPSKGEAHFASTDGKVEWRIPTKDLVSSGMALRCTIQAPLSESDDHETPSNGISSTTYDYDEDYQTATTAQRKTTEASGVTAPDRLKDLMPTSATLSFSVKGWLPSGLKVESLAVDAKRSRGLGADVKPYKGVKYLCVSQEGVETRC